MNKQSKKARKQKKKQDKNVDSQNTSANITDSRFAQVGYDPKFLTPSQQISKVKIDKRFARMLTDPQFKLSQKIDKYGRKIPKANRNKELEQYYYEENEDNDQLLHTQQQDNQEELQVDEENEQYDVDQSQQEGDYIRKWMEQYSAESSQESEFQEEQQVYEDNENVWSEEDESVMKGDNVQVTHRLALCNYDWMNISAKDLMLLFSSFKPATGFIRCVDVYLSDIGKIKLEQEEQHGPQGIWLETNQKKKDAKPLKQFKAGKHSTEEVFDEKKLRQYQKDRLKYYYAVITCDSKKTADDIYRQCDGNQFQNSNLAFDLRFISDDLTFDKARLKQTCNELPVEGEVKNFVNRAIGHSKVKLTWEDSQLSLAASLKRKNWNRMSEQELNKIDWGLYINEGEVEEEDNQRLIFKQQLKSFKDEEAQGGWRAEANKKLRNRDNEILITFGSGFSGQLKQESTQCPSIKKQRKSLKQKRRQAQQAKQKHRQQLQLLVDNDKGKDFKVDLHDPRFQAVYNDSKYSIDPVHPHFYPRRIEHVFKEVVKRNRSKNTQ